MSRTAWASLKYGSIPPQPADQGQVAKDGKFDRHPVARHNNGLNVIYLDGHAKWSRVGQFVDPIANGSNGNRERGWPYGDPKNACDNK